MGTCHTSPSVMVEDSVHCWEHNISGERYVTEIIPIPSGTTGTMTSSTSTNFPDEVHISSHRFRGNLITERVHVDESHQFPVTHLGDNSFEEAEKRNCGGEKDTCMMIRNVGPM